MNAQPDGFDAMLSRIDELERGNRRTKKVATIVVLATVAVLTMGQARSLRTVEAKKLIIRDSSGKARVVITGDAPSEGRLVHGGNIAILDDEEQPVVEIGTMHRASFLELKTVGQGQARTSLTSGSWGLEGEKGTVSVGFVTSIKSNETHPSILFFDSDHRTILSIPSQPE